MDPRFKDSLFKHNPDIYTSDWIRDCEDAFTNLLELEYSEAPTSGPAQGSAPIFTPSQTSEFAKTAVTVLGPSLDPSSASESPAEELQQYLQEKCMEQDQNPLLWWKQNQVCFPNLAQMAQDFLAIPGKIVLIHTHQVSCDLFT